METKSWRSRSTQSLCCHDAAVKHKGQPTVILTKSIRIWLVQSGESINTTHQQKKLGIDDMYYFRDRFDIPLTDKQVKTRIYRPNEKSDEIQYLKERRKALVVIFLRGQQIRSKLKLKIQVYLVINEKLW